MHLIVDPSDFKSMTVADLKEVCRNRGLKLSGTKADLISRIEDLVEE